MVRRDLGRGSACGGGLGTSLRCHGSAGGNDAPPCQVIRLPEADSSLTTRDYTLDLSDQGTGRREEGGRFRLGGRNDIKGRGMNEDLNKGRVK